MIPAAKTNWDLSVVQVQVQDVLQPAYTHSHAYTHAHTHKNKVCFLQALVCCLVRNVPESKGVFAKKEESEKVKDKCALDIAYTQHSPQM